MSSCCSSTQTESKAQNKKQKCPSSGQLCVTVSAKTIYHHIKQSWSWNDNNQGYYFCSDPNCKVVYFGEDDSTIEQSQLRTVVGVKTTNDNDLICYCYGVSLAQMKKDPKIRSFIAQRTKNSECACDTRNPSGRCCLKDFPK